MQRLRPLVLLFGLFGSSALAEPPSISGAVSVSSQSGATHLNLLDQEQNSDSEIYEVKASSGLMSNGLRLRVLSQHIQRDLAGYTLIDRRGNESSLAESFNGAEQFVSLGSDYNIKSYTISFDAGTTVTSSPLAQKQYTLGVARSFFELGADFNFTLTRAKQNQPPSYYVDPDSFESKPRPTTLTPTVANLAYSQIVTEELQTAMTLLYAQRPEDRPSHLGLGTRAAYGVNDRWAIHGGIEHLFENRNQALKDARGYLDLTSFDLGVAFEPVYNLVLRGGIGTSIETETARGNLPRQVVGTDSLDFSVEYRKAKLAVFTQANFQESNTRFRQSQIRGGVTWEI